MSLTIQTTLAGEVAVSATGWRNTVAVTIGGHTFKLTAVEAESLALALSATVGSTFDTPQTDSIFEDQPSRGFLVSAMGTRTASHVGTSKAALVEASFDALMSEC